MWPQLRHSHLDLALLEHLSGLHVMQQRAVALFVMLLDGADLAELLGKLGEAFLLGRLREALVHVGPLEVLAVCGILEVLRRGADALKLA